MGFDKGMLMFVRERRVEILDIVNLTNELVVYMIAHRIEKEINPSPSRNLDGRYEVGVIGYENDLVDYALLCQRCNIKTYLHIDTSLLHADELKITFGKFLILAFTSEDVFHGVCTWDVTKTGFRDFSHTHGHFGTRCQCFLERHLLSIDLALLAERRVLSIPRLKDAATAKRRTIVVEDSIEGSLAAFEPLPVVFDDVIPGVANQLFCTLSAGYVSPDGFSPARVKAAIYQNGCLRHVDPQSRKKAPDGYSPAKGLGVRVRDQLMKEVRRTRGTRRVSCLLTDKFRRVSQDCHHRWQKSCSELG